MTSWLTTWFVSLLTSGIMLRQSAMWLRAHAIACFKTCVYLCCLHVSACESCGWGVAGSRVQACQFAWLESCTELFSDSCSSWRMSPEFCENLKSHLPLHLKLTGVMLVWWHIVICSGLSTSRLSGIGCVQTALLTNLVLTLWTVICFAVSSFFCLPRWRLLYSFSISLVAVVNGPDRFLFLLPGHSQTYPVDANRTPRPAGWSSIFVRIRIPMMIGFPSIL